jgi:hypothetical protein
MVTVSQEVAREIRLAASGSRPKYRLSRTERVISVRLHAAARRAAVPCQISLPATVVLSWPGLFGWQWGWHRMCG